eukprot:TRINITY_DN4282_c1_g1_i4.p1 TRINITY_DN4282_c1_g1~~TRINITY_DN4282_c1_g1_i4.p1  ORF type:complete len:661 (-),score=57.60 TRINITY_DN4282_c1_g1_i4:238-2220(-)
MAIFSWLTSLLLYFILFSLSISLGSDFDYNKTCPTSACGDIKEITYPFYNVIHPKCGIYKIECVKSRPTIQIQIQIGESGRSYTVKNISYDERKIVIQDRQLYERLEAKDCNSLYNFTNYEYLFVPDFFMKLTTPTITIFNCKNYTLPLPPHVQFKISNYTGCKNSVLYFIPELDTLPPQSFPRERCSRFEIPVSDSSLLFNQNWTDDRLLPLLNKGFNLRWQPHSVCDKCHKKGGLCWKNDTTEIIWCCNDDCGDPGKPSKKKPIAIATATGVGGSLLLVAFFFIIYYCRKRFHSSSSTLLSRTTYSDSSSKNYLENSGIIFQTHVFTYNELEEATNNFDPSKELGDGGFGTVYHGKLRDGRFVAVKRLYENNCKRAEQFINEVEILSGLRHQHLVSLYGCTSRHSRELLLVYEFIPNGTVADHIHGHRANTLPWPIRLNIAIETADAIAYLHAIEPQIIHRDVKTNNILLDNNFHVKVADFGLSRLFPTDVTHVSTTPQGTPGYVDPEYHQCYQLTEKSDVYSFGVVLIELISSKPAVDVKRHQHEINLSSLAIRKIHNHALHELVDPCLGFESNGGVRKMITLVAELAFRCLQMDKDLRPSMKEVLEVLRGIEGERYEVEKTNGVESDDIVLLNISSSPVSVADKWVSRSTTPSSSG